MISHSRALAVALVLLTQSPELDARQFSTQERKRGIQETLLRLKVIEHDRRVGDPYLIHALGQPSQTVRRAAMLAAGRIGDPNALVPLSSLLNKRRSADKELAIFAISLIPTETAITMLVQHLAMQKRLPLITSLYEGIGLAGGKDHVEVLAQAIQASGTKAEPLAAACRAIGILWTKDSDNWPVPPGLLEKLASLAGENNATYSEACAFALSRFKGNVLQVPGTAILENIDKVKPSISKAFMAKALARARSNIARAKLVSLCQPNNPVNVRAEALKALITQPYSPSSQQALQIALKDKTVSLVIQALDTLSYHYQQGADLAADVQSLARNSPSRWVRGKAIRVLALLNPSAAHPLAESWFKAPKENAKLLPAAAFALGTKPQEKQLKELPSLILNTDYHVAEEAVDATSLLPETVITPMIRSALKQALEKGDPAVSSLVAQVAARFAWKDFSSSLAGVYPLFRMADHIEPKISILGALGLVANYSHQALLEQALLEDNRFVVEAAAEALKTLTRQDYSEKIPANSRMKIEPFSLEEIEAAQKARVELKTTRGIIQLQMLPEAPLTALNFVRLAKKKFYDGLTFHRVVPNFVAQGGDPRGDGYGGPGYLIRDEVSQVPHARGIVGLATAGRDTGGSQFYINLNDNFHLDGRYTAFAKVEKGLSVADKLEVGDTIQSVTISNR